MFLTNAFLLIFTQRGLKLIEMFRENFVHYNFYGQGRIKQRSYRINHSFSYLTYLYNFKCKV